MIICTKKLRILFSANAINRNYFFSLYKSHSTGSW